VCVPLVLIYSSSVRPFYRLPPLAVLRLINSILFYRWTTPPHYTDYKWAFPPPSNIRVKQDRRLGSGSRRLRRYGQGITSFTLRVPLQSRLKPSSDIPALFFVLLYSRTSQTLPTSIRVASPHLTSIYDYPFVPSPLMPITMLTLIHNRAL
jgi:hypothetical protein